MVIRSIMVAPYNSGQHPGQIPARGLSLLCAGRMTFATLDYISRLMNMTEAKFVLRMCFIVLFGAMSLMHGPVMAYAGHHLGAFHHTPPSQTDSGHGGHRDHDGHHAGAVTVPDVASLPDGATCNSFACFIAVEPLKVAAAPLHAVLIGPMVSEPQISPASTNRIPDTPPPRIEG